VAVAVGLWEADAAALSETVPVAVACDPGVLVPEAVDVAVADAARVQGDSAGSGSLAME
jgi:hypothetical protein